MGLKVEKWKRQKKNKKKKTEIKKNKKVDIWK